MRAYKLGFVSKLGVQLLWLSPYLCYIVGGDCFYFGSHICYLWFYGVLILVFLFSISHSESYVGDDWPHRMDEWMN